MTTKQTRKLAKKTTRRFVAPEHASGNRPIPYVVTGASGPDGRKDDEEKMRPLLLPVFGLYAVIAVLEYGAKKYEADGWRRVDNAESRYLNAAMRHLLSRLAGEKLDPESGLPHLAHAVCCLLFVLEVGE